MNTDLEESVEDVVVEWYRPGRQLLTDRELLKKRSTAKILKS